MDVDTMTLLGALLTLAGWVALGALGVVGVAAAAGSGGARRTLTGLRSALSTQGLALAFVVAAVATSGSLYLSEVAHFLPCKLCWYQRIAMYPLVPLLGLAGARRDRGIRAYALVLAVSGGIVSLYHVGVERIEWLDRSSSCDPFNPCTIRWVEELGFMTIPVMAGTAFALVAVILLLTPPSPEETP